MAKVLTWAVVGLMALLLLGCGAGPRAPKKQADLKPSKGQLCRFERGNCQTILIVDELPQGGVDAR